MIMMMIGDKGKWYSDETIDDDDDD